MSAVTIDWDVAAVRAIIDCLDGKQAWRLLLEYVAPHRGERIALRDAIWAERQKVMPRRGGRSRPRRALLRAAPAATSSRDEVSKPTQPAAIVTRSVTIASDDLGGRASPSVRDLATFEEIRKELTPRPGPTPRKIVYRPAAPAPVPAREERPTHPSRWHGVAGPPLGERCVKCLGGDFWRSGALGGCWCCYPPRPGWRVERFST